VNRIYPTRFVPGHPGFDRCPGAGGLRNEDGTADWAAHHEPIPLGIVVDRAGPLWRMAARRVTSRPQLVFAPVRRLGRARRAATEHQHFSDQRHLNSCAHIAPEASREG
jgi:hypothetical protein